MAFWIWVGRIKTPLDAATRLVFFVTLAAVMNHLRAILADGPDRHGFGTSFFDAAFVAVPLGIMALLLLSRLGRLQDELEVLATTDPLTRLPNRRVMIERMEKAVLKEESGTVLIADIDFFKRINDTYGHAAGDACIQAVAAHLVFLCGRENVARFGGEEFVAFLPNVSARAACEIANKIAAGTDISALGARDHVTLSVGIAQLRVMDQMHDLMQRADEALYLAKSRGRACAVDWDRVHPSISPETLRPRATA